LQFTAGEREKRREGRVERREVRRQEMEGEGTIPFETS
jgi:hypothetical protein